MKQAFLSRTVGWIAATGLIFLAPVTRGDDLATVFQYELALGGGHAVSSFYFACQPDGMRRVASFNTDGASALFRIPVYSTDPAMRTMLSRLSVSMRAGGGARP